MIKSLAVHYQRVEPATAKAEMTILLNDGSKFKPGYGNRGWLKPFEVDRIVINMTPSLAEYTGEVKIGQAKLEVVEGGGGAQKVVIMTDALRQQWQASGKLTLSKMSSGAAQLKAVPKHIPESEVVVYQRQSIAVPGSFDFYPYR
ncbi:MAG: hypothetical protein HN790_00865 [Methylococcales bacterium]|nr:hypothetical protein [Methylococcales bacterium]